MNANNNNIELNYSRMSRTDLNSHSNMVVVEKNCTIMREKGRHAEVTLFAPDYEILHKVPIVDASIEHYTQHTYLVFHGVL